MIKASDVIAAVLRLGEQNPDETRGCCYVNDDGTPCCIVGIALIEHGLDPEAFLDDVQLNQWTNAQELFTFEAERLGLEFDVPNGRLDDLRETQKLQDHGEPWGVAIRGLRG